MLLDVQRPKLSDFEVLELLGRAHRRSLSPYAKDSWPAILTDDIRLPVSRSGYARLKELIG